MSRCPSLRRNGVPPLVSLLFIVLLSSFFSGCGDSGDPPGDEVWVIGLDGADWDMLDPMIERGELPNLAALRDGGAWGVLRSDEPMLSPILWTSIATGRTPDVHGVTWFMTDAPDGSKVPVGTFDRRVHAFWNVADEAGLNCGVVGWWASWPAEQLDGFVVSDYVGWHSFGVTGRETVDEGKTWPPDLMDDVRDVLPHPTDVAADLLATMVHLPGGDLGDRAADIEHLRQSIATTRGYTDLVKRRLRTDRPDLLCLYYEGTDAVMHLFGDAMPPRQPWIDEADFAAYRDAVAGYWRWQDELLGELLAMRGPRTTVVVVSDHGFRTGDERRREDRFDIHTADADHMIDGVIVVNGPDVRPGLIEGADIYDVAPTVLHTLGLPVADDLAGAVLADVFAPDSPRGRAPARVASFENRPLRRPEPAALGDEAGQAMETMLRSLGYIAGSSDGVSEPTEPVSHTVEQSVNLATIYMAQGKLDEAVDELRKVLDETPGHVEARLNLAGALARRGDTDAAVTLYRELLDQDASRLDAREDLGLTLGRAGRTAEALTVYDEGLALDGDWLTGRAGRGHTLFALGRTADAERELRAVLAVDPRHLMALDSLGQLLVDAGRWDEAAQVLESAVTMDPGAVEAALRLASVHERAGRPDKALEALTRCEAGGGEGPALDNALGTLLLRTGDPLGAVPHLERAAAADPSNPDPLGNLGLARAMGGDIAGAAATFERVVALLPESSESHAQLGSFYAQLGRHDDAERELRAAVRYDETDPAGHLHLGMLLHQSGRLDEARTEYERAVELAPDMAVAWYNLGMIEGAAGHSEEASRLISRARELDPSLPRPGGGRAGAAP